MNLYFEMKAVFCSNISRLSGQYSLASETGPDRVITGGGSLRQPQNYYTISIHLECVCVCHLLYTAITESSIGIPENQPNTDIKGIPNAKGMF